MRCSGRKCVLATLLGGVLLLAAGCDGEKLPLPPSPTVASPATEEAITAEIEKGLAPLYHFVLTLTRQTPVPQQFGESLKEHLKVANAKHRDTREGKEALRSVVRHLEDVLKVARQAQNGLAVLLICDLIKIVEPNNSRIPRYEEWATIEKNRPVVMLRGWYEDREKDPPVLHAFLEVYLPETGEVEHVRVREGEEFLGLKYRKIIGDRRGMLLEYLKTGDRFKVYLRSWP